MEQVRPWKLCLARGFLNLGGSGGLMRGAAGGGRKLAAFGGGQSVRWRAAISSAMILVDVMLDGLRW